MLRKLALSLITFFAFWGYLHPGLANSAPDDDAWGLKQKGAKGLTLVASAMGQLTPVSQEEEYEELKEELERLLEEMKRLKKEAEKKVLNEILPLIKEEIERLREKLRKWHLEDDEEEPVQV